MTLLEECIEALGDSVKVLTHEESKEMFRKFSGRIPITDWGRIDWSEINKIQITDKVDLKQYFNHSECLVFWDNASHPVIKTTLSKFIEEIDEVLAVSFDTWITDLSIEEVVEFYHDGDISYAKLF